MWQGGGDRSRSKKRNLDDKGVKDVEGEAENAGSHGTERVGAEEDDVRDVKDSGDGDDNSNWDPLCKTCGDGYSYDGDAMLLCDSCDSGFHQACLRTLPRAY